MIRKSLPATKDATWVVNALDDAPPHQVGTCFVIDPTGFILTADYVIHTRSGRPRTLSGLLQPRPDLDAIDWSTDGFERSSRGLAAPTLVQNWPGLDLALMKVDIPENAEGTWLAGRTELPFIELDFDIPEDGTPVYCYGYPLPRDPAWYDFGNHQIAFADIAPRTTSAIISSNRHADGSIASPGMARTYVLDKALNYGNSGGPVVLAETGRAISVVSGFQPVEIAQSDEEDAQLVFMPSLYGYSSAVRNIQAALATHVPFYA